MKYWKKISQSARGEAFNPLIWPSLFATLIYGIGFTVFLPLGLPVGSSSLYNSMNEIQLGLAFLWGLAALVTIGGGLFFLLFDKPPLGKFTGLLGFMVWTFAGISYIITGDWLVFGAVAFPNMWFWFWQYLSLADFRRQEIEDSNNRES